MDRLLKLIEEGDTEAILSEKELVPEFNELLKYDLIYLKDEKIYLTEEGKAAKIEGVDVVISRKKQTQLEKLQQKASPVKIFALPFNLKAWRTNKNFLLIIFLFLTFLILLGLQAVK